MGGEKYAVEIFASMIGRRCEDTRVNVRTLSYQALALEVGPNDVQHGARRHGCVGLCPSA